MKPNPRNENQTPFILEPLHFDPARETKDEWAERAVKQIKAGLLARAQRVLVAELESLNLQQRIDRIAADLKSKQNRYKLIDTWQVAELLGLDFDDTADWSHHHLCHRVDLDDVGFDRPYAENIELLKGEIPAKRFRKLVALAQDGEDDLPLTSKEVELLKDAYAEANAESSDLVLAMTSLKASNGEELWFEVCIGCAGEASAACSPYDLEKGGGLNTEDYILID